MYLNTCDGNMQEGSLRADVNISVRKFGDDLGTRCEIKNLNSIKFIRQAIEYETKRQINLIENGNTIKQSTLLFDPKNGETRPMREKEEAHDYRYFPDPDLLPLELTDEFINLVSKEIPELPDHRKLRYVNDYTLSNYDAQILISDKATSDFFDNILNIHVDLKKFSKLIVNWITTELFALLKKNNLEIINSPISPDNMGKLIKFISTDEISGKIAKEILEDMFYSKKSPENIIKEKGLSQVSNSDELNKIIDEIIKDNFQKVEEYRNGKEKLLGFFVGQIMKTTNGKANPKIVNQLLLKKLKKD